MASYAVCLTFVPSIAGHWSRGDWYRKRKWDRALGRVVAVLHHKPWIPVIITFLLIAGSVYVLISKVEHGRTWNFGGTRENLYISFAFPPGTPQEITDDVARKFEEILTSKEGILSTRTTVYGEGSFIYSHSAKRPSGMAPPLEPRPRP